MRRTRFRFPRRTAAVAVALAALLGGGLAVSPTAQAVDIRSDQWYLDAMQAPAMWQVSTGKGITVAVVDSGVNAQQAELRGKVLPGQSFGGKADSHKDYDGHGTTMALLIAGNGLGGRGVQGVAPGARILPLVDMYDRMPEAIRYAADHGARVINVSQGFAAYDTVKDLPQLAAAVKYAVQRGALVFASVGNDGKKGYPVNPPASLPGAVGVTAIDKTGKVADFASHGAHVVLAAPGVSIPGDCSKALGDQKGYCLGQGTSEATAIASASAALIWSAHPHWTNNQVLRVMIDTASRPATGPIPSDYLGYGGVRPRLVLLGKNVDPGPANVNPLYPHLLDKPAPNASDSARSAPASTGPGAAPAASPVSSSGSGLVWVAVGAAAVVVVVVIAVVVVLRGRGQVSLAVPRSPVGTVPPPPYGGSAYGQSLYAPRPPEGYDPPPQSYGPPPGGN